MRPHLHVRHRNRRNIHLLDQSMSPEPNYMRLAGRNYSSNYLNNYRNQNRLKNRLTLEN